MPEWLLEEENYVPPKDKDAFVDKSILSLMKVLSKIQRQDKVHEYSINPFIRILCTIILIIFLSLSKNFLFVTLVLVYLLFVLSSLKVEEIKNIIALTTMAMIFTLIILLPSIFLGNIRNSVLIITKVIASVLSINILSYSLSWNEFTSALKYIKVSDIFILVFDIAIKYIFVLGDLSLNMLYALKLRAIGKNRGKHGSLYGIMGNVFLTSHEMSEEVYNAMQCRGFTGEYNYIKNDKFTIRDFTYIFLNAILILIYFYFARM